MNNLVGEDKRRKLYQKVQWELNLATIETKWDEPTMVKFIMEPSQEHITTCNLRRNLTGRYRTIEISLCRLSWDAFCETDTWSKVAGTEDRMNHQDFQPSNLASDPQVNSGDSIILLRP